MFLSDQMNKAVSFDNIEKENSGKFHTFIRIWNFYKRLEYVLLMLLLLKVAYFSTILRKCFK